MSSRLPKVHSHDASFTRKTHQSQSTTTYTYGVGSISHRQRANHFAPKPVRSRYACSRCPRSYWNPLQYIFVIRSSLASPLHFHAPSQQRSERKQNNTAPCLCLLSCGFMLASIVGSGTRRGEKARIERGSSVERRVKDSLMLTVCAFFRSEIFSLLSTLSVDECAIVSVVNGTAARFLRTYNSWLTAPSSSSAPLTLACATFHALLFFVPVGTRRVIPPGKS